jgi:hypothetical protein
MFFLTALEHGVQSSRQLVRKMDVAKEANLVRLCLGPMQSRTHESFVMSAHAQCMLAVAGSFYGSHAIEEWDSEALAATGGCMNVFVPFFRAYAGPFRIRVCVLLHWEK